ncbi:MAG TPA: hypothetical protein VHG28_13580 [Longimicrobiaceae bacterium]|nr:hypothetical protein [Longimicrobiaceae bacterium]
MLPEIPFMEEELYLAMRLGFPEAEARQLATAMATLSPGAIGWGFTEDTLMLISLASPELEKKVADFRARWGRIYDEATWDAKRAEMKQALIDAGKLPPDA